MSNLNCCNPVSDCNLPTPCVNPIIHLLRSAVNMYNDNNSNDLYEYLESILDEGLIVSGNNAMCCPSVCGNLTPSFYFLGQPNSFVDICTKKGLNVIVSTNYPTVLPNKKFDCCVNLAMSPDDYSDYYDSFVVTNNTTGAIVLDKLPETCCDNGFSNTINRLNKETRLDNFVIGAGLVEAGKIGTKSSQIDVILDYFKSLSPAISKTVLTETLSILFSQGVYVECDGCNTIIKSGVRWDYFYNRS